MYKVYLMIIFCQVVNLDAILLNILLFIAGIGISVSIITLLYL